MVRPLRNLQPSDCHTKICSNYPEIRDYDRLFLTPVPGEESGDFLKDINPNSLNKRNGIAEPSLANVKPGNAFQFQRKGYYAVDNDTSLGKVIFNKTVGLRDTWKA